MTYSVKPLLSFELGVSALPAAVIASCHLLNEYHAQSYEATLVKCRAMQQCSNAKVRIAADLFSLYGNRSMG